MHTLELVERGAQEHIVNPEESRITNANNLSPGHEALLGTSKLVWYDIALSYNGTMLGAHCSVAAAAHV
jgi:hypothetical protein